MPVRNPVPATLSLDELMDEFDSEVKRLEDERNALEEDYKSGRMAMRMNFAF